MDSIAQLIATLFLLSMINERVVSFIKLTFSGLLWLGNLKHKLADNEAEQARERRIVQVNIFCGFLVALAVQADLIAMLQHINDGKYSLGWEQVPDIAAAWTRTLLGCLLTGCLISLGSKFWHDVLDLVLAVKNIKQEQGKPPSALSGQDLFSLLQESSRADRIRTAVETHGGDWIRSYSNVIGCGPDVRLKDGSPTGEQVIRFRVSRKESDIGAIPLPVPASIRLSDGLEIPTDVVESAQAIACWNNPGTHTGPVVMGTSLSRSNFRCTGTIGLRVWKKIAAERVPCLLTCFHVAFPELILQDEADANYPFQDGIPGKLCVAPGLDTGLQRRTLGEAIQGELTNLIDAALIRVAPSLQTQELPGCNLPVVHFKYASAPLGSVSISFIGANSGVKGTYTWKADQQERIQYADEHDRPRIKTMNSLVILTGKPAAQGGDSGALAVTSDGRILGMVIASDKISQTWVRPIVGLDKAMGFEFPTSSTL